MRVFALILPTELAKKVGEKLSGLSRIIIQRTPDFRTDMKHSTIDMTPEQYLGASIASAGFLGLLLFLMVFIPLSFTGDYVQPLPALFGLVPAVIIFLLNFFILLQYPKILTLKRAEIIDRDLIFALKDLNLNTSAGLSLYDAVHRVAKSNYGFVSEDFNYVINQSNEGIALDDALEELAIESKSKYMRNSLWQIINAFRSGAGIKDALDLLIRNLINEQQRKIRDYTQELNVLTMLYMLIAVAIPSIILTLLVVLTSFLGAGITPDLFALVVLICLMAQMALAFIIKSRRPKIYLD